MNSREPIVTPPVADPRIAERGFASPEALVSTDWVAEHLEDPRVRLAESNEDSLLYATGHIPGAVEVDWTRDLNDPLRRDYIGREGFEKLCLERGISNDTTVVLYGDRNNWWAAYAFWLFKLFGHQDVRLMDGGRIRWIEEGRELSKQVPEFEPTAYTAPERDDSENRAFREEVLQHMTRAGMMIDVRSPQEFTGERLHMEEYPNEGALRGGHIPGAENVPWSRAVDPEVGTFLSPDRLREIYLREAGLLPEERVIVYCRIGERSSHTWFVLKYLLGFPDVKNYDGSWTEWGNSVGLPIER